MKSIHLIDEGYVSDVYFKDSSSMEEIENEKIMLVETSPPYWNLKDYSDIKPQEGKLPASPDDYYQTYPEYLEMLKKVFSECHRVLNPRGTMLINADIIKIKTDDKNIIPIPFDIMNLCTAIGFGCKDILIYKKSAGVPFEIGKKLPNRHEYLLMFSKSNDYKFNIDAVRIPYPEDYVYPPGHDRRNDIGMLPTSVWDFNIPFQSGGDLHYHYCPFPHGLVDRAIKLFTDEKDWVLDPFLGSGRVLSRAKFLHRNGIGYEINPLFREMIMNEIKNTRVGTDEEIHKIVDYSIEKNVPKNNKKIKNAGTSLDVFAKHKV